MLHMRDVYVHLKTGTCTGSLIDDDDGERVCFLNLLSCYFKGVRVKNIIHVSPIFSKIVIIINTIYIMEKTC